MQHCLSWWLLHTGESGQAEAGQAGASPWPHASTSQLWQVSDILSFVFTILIIWHQHSLCIAFYISIHSVQLPSLCALSAPAFLLHQTSRCTPTHKASPLTLCLVLTLAIANPSATLWFHGISCLAVSCWHTGRHFKYVSCHADDQNERHVV